MFQRLLIAIAIATLAPATFVQASAPLEMSWLAKAPDFADGLYSELYQISKISHHPTLNRGFKQRLMGEKLERLHRHSIEASLSGNWLVQQVSDSNARTMRADLATVRNQVAQGKLEAATRTIDAYLASIHPYVSSETLDDCKRSSR